MRAARVSLVATGCAMAVFGVVGLLRNASRTHPLNWLEFVAGGLVAHDAVLAPAVALASVVLVRLVPAGARATMTSALFVSGVLALVAIPVIGGRGRLANNPSILPSHHYARSLLIAIAVVWAVATLVALVRRRRGGRHVRPS